MNDPVSSGQMADRLEAHEQARVDVVVPVYRAAASLDRCLASVFLHTTFPPHRLIVVVDGPQPETVEEVLTRRTEEYGDFVHLIRMDYRTGFVAAVNRGMSASSRDVVLLNSDTEVTAGWLHKLREAAYSAPRIATVTPLSNNATICSLPEFLEDNALPAAISADAMGEIVERVTRRERPRLPTGVGVCLYIRRQALDAVGLFDEKSFGLGYGEENEFCCRATAAGFEHLADDATFVFHEGQKSFGADSARRRRSAMRKLRAKDRTYVPRVAEFIEKDPMAPIRERVVAEIGRRRKPLRDLTDGQPISILHVVHGWPPFDTGGTEVYARSLALEQARRHRVSVFARSAGRDRSTGQRTAYLDHGIRVRLVCNNFDRRNPIARNAIKDRYFERELELFIKQVEPDLVHIHHLAGHCASLMGVVLRAGIRAVYQVQDWWALCARANLWQPNENLCPGPNRDRCATCLPLTELPPRRPLNRFLYRLRAWYIRRQMGTANAYVMGSQAIRNWYDGADLFAPGSGVHVLDYGVEPIEGIDRDRSAAEAPLTFGFIGALMPHKGAHVAVEAFRGLTPDRARLVLWGNPDSRPDYGDRLRAMADANTVTFAGVFDEARKAEVLSSIDVLIVPSVGLESYGIVAREALSAGVPVLVSRRGALEELSVDGICGATFAAEDPGDLRRLIDRLIDRPDMLDEWRRGIPGVITVEEHATAIDTIYRQVIDDGQ
jgi:glycosyltransferase involved in cell wall biosynthesis/GT2 family glycosyltransferase